MFVDEELLFWCRQSNKENMRFGLRDLRQDWVQSCVACFEAQFWTAHPSDLEARISLAQGVCGSACCVGSPPEKKHPQALRRALLPWWSAEFPAAHAWDSP